MVRENPGLEMQVRDFSFLEKTIDSKDFTFRFLIFVHF